MARRPPSLGICGYRGGQGSGICFSRHLSTFAATACAVHPGRADITKGEGQRFRVLAEVERLAMLWSEPESGFEPRLEAVDRLY